jgi:hypothetical protein
VCFHSVLPPLRYSLVIRSFIDRIDSTAKARLNAIRDRALGPVNERSLHPPTQYDGVYIGGTAYERHYRAVPVHKGGRCYSNANSAQTVKDLVSLHAAAKMDSSKMDAHQVLERDINLVSLLLTSTKNVVC